MEVAWVPVDGRGGPQLIPRPPGVRDGAPAPWASVALEERAIDTARVRAAFAAAGPGRPSPVEGTTARSAAVLAPLYDEAGSTRVVLTRRAQHLRAHRGEVSFPGGGRDGDESLVATALREAQEEIGLDPSTVAIVGELDHLTTVTSSAYVVPFVGVIDDRPIGLRPQEAEVERILHVPLAELLLDGVYHEELWPLGQGVERRLSFFDLEDDTIWGATAGMLRQLLSVVLGVVGP
ncbi:MAG: CoA pyrophosphatase [Actinomycetota bacterium]|nr:CoA pyrophosphatase [Actinomycetota bacterium]